jgi:peptide/nickel transport system permease protein
MTIRLIPGSIIDTLLGEMGSENMGAGINRAELERMLGLDVPLQVQYARWIGDIFTHASLGKAMRGGEPVTQKIIERLPVTFELGFLAIIIGLVIALPIGVYSAVRQDTAGDYLGRSLAIIFISIPSFWTGTMIMIYPSIWWGWSPPMELITFTDDPMGNLRMFAIPSIILGMALSGTTMRMTRTMMLEELRQDYIRTAWSKGLKERVVVMRHALRNSLIPVITIIGYQIPLIVGGSVIIEQIFVLPGIGRLMVQALGQRDYTVVSGVNLFVAAVVLLVNLLVDVTYGFLDPRVHYR